MINYVAAKGGKMSYKPMFMQTVVCVAILSIFTALFPVIASAAGWMDDFINQQTVTDAGYFDGQKRGYMTGGSFSARWKTGNDYLMSFEPPRVKFGCGGIDAFMGGFSFLNFDYLVTKLQRVLQGAPAAAFDMALNTLCTPCSNTIKSMEAISNTLNSIQLDDCKSSKVVVASIADQFGSFPKLKAEADQSYEMMKGLKDLPNKITSIWNANDNEPQVPVTDTMSGCPAALKQVVLSTNTTLLAQMAIYKIIPESHANFLRGLFGDIKFVQKGDPPKSAWVPVPKCDDNNNLTVDKFMRGEVYTRSATGTDGETVCAKITDAKSDLLQWAYNIISAIAVKLEAKTALTEEEKNFINSIPIPIHPALKVAITTGQVASIVYQMSDLAAKAYAYKMMSEATNTFGNTMHSIKVLIAKEGQSPRTNCQVDQLTGLIPELDKMTSNALKYNDMFYKSYVGALQENKTVLAVAEQLEKFNKKAAEELSKAFSPSLAGRALSGGL